MSIAVLRGNNLEIKSGLFFYRTSTQIKWQNVTLIQKMSNLPIQINSQILKSSFSNFWEALQFEAAVPQLHIFHMDLQPPTHVQIKIPMVDV